MKLSLPLFKRQKNGEAGPSVKPYRDWLIMLCVTAVLLVGALAWTGGLFWRVKAESAIYPEKPPIPVLLNEKLLSDTVSFYEARKAGFDNPKPAPEFLVDPSL